MTDPRCNPALWKLAHCEALLRRYEGGATLLLAAVERERARGCATHGSGQMRLDGMGKVRCGLCEAARKRRAAA